VPTPAAVYTRMGQALNAGEVIHVQHSYAFFGGMKPWRRGWQALLAAVRRPLVVTIHEIDDRARGVYHLPAPLELAYKRWHNRAAFVHPAIDAWIVHSRPTRDALAALGVPDERLHYWRHPVETHVAPLPDRDAARERFEAADRRVLTILGFIARRKGYDLALDALAQLPNDVMLLVAGGEHAADRSGSLAWLKARVAEAGLGRRVRITGYLADEDLLQAVAASDLILAPFREVSGSGSLALAMARGMPVLAADLPALADITCLERFPAGDAPALAAAVERLLASPERLNEMRAATVRYAEANSYATVAERTLALYASMR